MSVIEIFRRLRCWMVTEVTDIVARFWKRIGIEEVESSMATIEEVRAAEKKLQELVNALRRASAEDPDNLSAQLKTASDEYAKAVRELGSSRPSAD